MKSVVVLVFVTVNICILLRAKYDPCVQREDVEVYEMFVLSL